MSPSRPGPRARRRLWTRISSRRGRRGDTSPWPTTMPTIAHISDLHFGAEDPIVAAGLLKDLAELQPTLVVNSGDLTQRGRASQFRAARDYLARIPFPQLTIPGNHDIPLYDVTRRFLSPLGRYKRYITPNLAPRLGVMY